MSGILGSFVARGAFAITPSATPLVTTYGSKAYGIYVGVTGNITVTGEDGVSVTYTNFPAGGIIPLVCTHVTSATAGGLVGHKVAT